MILIWANFNAQSFIHLKLSMKCLELFFYVSTCSQQRWAVEVCIQMINILKANVHCKSLLENYFWSILFNGFWLILLFLASSWTFCRLWFGCFKSIRNLISLKVCVWFLGGSRVRKFEFLTPSSKSSLYCITTVYREDGVCIVFGLILTLFWMSWCAKNLRCFSINLRNKLWPLFRRAPI